MARGPIVNNVRGFNVATQREHGAETAGMAAGMSSAARPGDVCLSVTEPTWPTDDPFTLLPPSVMVYLSPAQARELGLELVTLAARLAPDNVLGAEPNDAGHDDSGAA